MEQATSMYTNEYCQQLKRCMEIAVECLEVDRIKRPTIGNIIDELVQIEKLIPNIAIIEESSSLQKEGSGGLEENVLIS